jgi:hypothetical protein
LMLMGATLAVVSNDHSPSTAGPCTQAMGAYRTILTHFSQRYPKFPEGLPAEGAAAASTAIAFDGMRVPLAALPLLPALRPAVEYVLASEEEEEEKEKGQEQGMEGGGIVAGNNLA